MRRYISPMGFLIAAMLSGGALAADESTWRTPAALRPAAAGAGVLARAGESAAGLPAVVYAMPGLKARAEWSAHAGEDVTLLELGNAPLTSEIGLPRLPVVPARIVLPPGCDIDDVVVETGAKIDMPGSYVVDHGRRPYPLMRGITPDVTMPDPGVYDLDEPYPGRLFDVVGVQRQCGVSIALVNLYPVEYRPASGRLASYSTMTLAIRSKKALEKTALAARPERVAAGRQAVDNPEALLELYGGEAARALDKDIGQAGFCSPLADYRYVIITSRAIRDATTDYTIRDLLARRQGQGLTATIVAVEDIYTDYTGTDNAEKVRNFIRDAYNNWGTECVLLGGDIHIVPMRKLYCLPYEGGDADDIPSDLYFQCLDGTYNNDGDSRWGEPTDGPGGGDVDLFAEVLIGRAPAESAAEMANFVYKTLAYENDPASSPYKQKALMVGEYLGFGGASDYASGMMEEIRLGSSAHGYTTMGFASSPIYTVDTLYDSGEYEWSKATMLGKISSGVYGIFNHLGHADYNYVMKFYNSDANTLTNTSFLFAYSQGCIAGDFERDCVAERLTTSTRHGMFAVVFNSRFGWGTRDSTDGPSQCYDREFWDAYFDGTSLLLGGMNAESHERNAYRINQDCMRWCYYESNLLGDPVTQLASPNPPTPPDVPNGVIATDGLYGDRIVVAWNASARADGYEVWRNTLDDSGTAARLGTTLGLSYVDAGTPVNVVYYYWVKATNAHGASAFSAGNSGYRREPTPGLLAFSQSSWSVHENAGSASISVARTAGNDFPASVSYSVQDSSAIAGVDYLPVTGTLSWLDGDSASRTFSVPIVNRTGKQANRVFTVVLSGVAGASLGAQSSAAVTIVDRSPPAPTGVTAGDGIYADAVIVYWDTVAVATSYIIWRSSDGDVRHASVRGSSALPAYLDTGVAAGNTYYYWIQAVNEASDSDLSAPDSGYCCSVDTALATPANVSASAGTYTDKVRVNWQAVNGSAAYEIWRSLKNDIAAAARVGDASGTGFNDTPPAHGVCYYYWVRARNGGGSVGGYSAPGAGWKRLSPPDTVDADDGSRPYRVQARWTPVANAAWYELWREEVPGEHSTGGNLTRLAQTPATFFDDYETVAGVYYRYKVKAVNALCASDFAVNTGYRSPVNHAASSLPARNDFDGDGLSDLALCKAASGEWNVLCSSLGRQTFAFGVQGCHAAAGDLNGDGKTDPVICRPTDGLWLAMFPNGAHAPIAEARFGAQGNAMAVMADFDGDRMSDPAIYDEAGGILSVMLSAGGAYAECVSCPLGAPGYAPVAADFDGDGLSDPAAYSEQAGKIEVRLSGNGYAGITLHMGGPGYSAVAAADFDGDGLSDPAWYQESSGAWIILLSGAGHAAARIAFGGPGYRPAAGDYDGDGLFDPAIYRDSTGQWLIMLSGNGYAVGGETFGGSSFQAIE